MNTIEVSDSLSNTEEQIERAAKTIGKGKRREVFEAIYQHKSKIKTVAAIADKTHLTRMRVLQEGRHLVQRGIVRQAKKDHDTAYEKIDFFHAHKKQILRLAANPTKLANLPTKRKVTVPLPKSVTISSAGARVNRITVDDIGSFKKVKKVKIAGSLPASMTEKQFKDGVQSIVGEPGDFKDWGGERRFVHDSPKAGREESGRCVRVQRAGRKTEVGAGAHGQEWRSGSAPLSRSG